MGRSAGSTHGGVAPSGLTPSKLPSFLGDRIHNLSFVQTSNPNNSNLLHPSHLHGPSFATDPKQRLQRARSAALFADDSGESDVSAASFVSPMSPILQSGRAVRVTSIFALESMPGRLARALLVVFYLSVLVAFFQKIWSEHTLVVDNVCSGAPGGLDFSSWSSDMCRADFRGGELIPVEHMPFPHVQCPGGPDAVCYRWSGTLPAMNFLSRKVFMSFVVEAVSNESLSIDLWLAGWVHAVNDSGHAGGYASTVPRTGGLDRDSAAMQSSNASLWDRQEVILQCKAAQLCDVIVFEEPLFRVNERHRFQLLLFGAEVLAGLGVSSNRTAAEGPHINIAFVHTLPAITVVDVVCRYLFMGIAVWLAARFLRRLGMPRPACCPRRQPLADGGADAEGEAPRSKWHTEQRWMLFLLLCLVLYLNPLSLPMTMLEAEEGREVTGDERRWRDRILLFIDHNVAMYVENLVRVFEITFLACCLGEDARPKMTWRWRERRRAWLYWVAILWFGCVLMVDWAKLYTDYHIYYNREHGNIWNRSNSSSEIDPATVLLLIWFAGMLVYFVRAAHALSRQRYWLTRSRQLSFRFFFFLYIWHIIYTFTDLIYCWWKYNKGRHVFESLVCTTVPSLNTGVMIANAVFILSLAIVFGPPPPHQGLPPDPLRDRSAWVHKKWPQEWIQWVNSAASSTLYFFYWLSERLAFNIANDISHGGLWSSSARRRLGGVAASTASHATGVTADRSKPKRMFCLELAVDLLCLSWEVYGEEPGTDHSHELERGDPQMPIDCERHGCELLDIVNGCVEEGRASVFEARDARHAAGRHTLLYRYMPIFLCASGPECAAGFGTAGAGMAYVCFEPECSTASGRHYAMCRQCFKEGHRPPPEDSAPEEQEQVIQRKPSHATVRSSLVDLIDEAIIQRVTLSEDEIKCADLQAIICRDDDRIVVAFRGTSNFANIKTDIQFLRDVFHPLLDAASQESVRTRRYGLRVPLGVLKRLKARLGWGLPRCHRGFLRAFRSIGPEVVKRLAPILQAHPHHDVAVTGHSLGGALAMLMACEIWRTFGRRPSVYTYGSPRVGNRTFAKLYNAAIPDTFRIVNQSDIISTLPWSFFGIFKHCGKEVCIDRRGNLIIEPTFIEQFISPTKVDPHTGPLTLHFRAKGNVADHQMSRYAVALNAVSEYFGVLDCMLDMKPAHKPMWLQSRRRWDAAGCCVLCGQSCSESSARLSICERSGGPHKPWLRSDAQRAVAGTLDESGILLARNHALGHSLRSRFEAARLSYKDARGNPQLWTVAQGLLNFESRMSLVDDIVVKQLRYIPEKHTVYAMPGSRRSVLNPADAPAIIDALRLLAYRTTVRHDLDRALAGTGERGAAVAASTGADLSARPSALSIGLSQGVMLQGSWLPEVRVTPATGTAEFPLVLPVSPLLPHASSHSEQQALPGRPNIASFAGAAGDLLDHLLGPPQTTEYYDPAACGSTARSSAAASVANTSTPLLLSPPNAGAPRPGRGSAAAGNNRLAPPRRPQRTAVCASASELSATAAAQPTGPVRAAAAAAVPSPPPSPPELAVPYPSQPWAPPPAGYPPGAGPAPPPPPSGPWAPPPAPEPAYGPRLQAAARGAARGRGAAPPPPGGGPPRPGAALWAPPPQEAPDVRLVPPPRHCVPPQLITSAMSGSATGRGRGWAIPPISDAPTARPEPSTPSQP